MAFITAFIDIRDANGVSLVPQNADGTTPVKVLQLGAGILATYAKSGDLGIVTIARDDTIALSVPSLAVTGPDTALVVTNDASVGGILTIGLDVHVGTEFQLLGTVTDPTEPLLTWFAGTHPYLIVGDRGSGGGANLLLCSLASGASLPTLPSSAGHVVINAGTSIAIGIQASPWMTFDATGIGEYGHATIGKGGTFVQTYSTTGLTLNPASTSPFTGQDSLQVGFVYAKAADLEALRGDLLNALGVLNSIIDYWQARGTIG